MLLSYKNLKDGKEYQHLTLAEASAMMEKTIAAADREGSYAHLALLAMIAEERENGGVAKWMDSFAVTLTKTTRMLTSWWLERSPWRSADAEMKDDFRRLAKIKGLAFGGTGASKHHFLLDLNHGPFHAHADAEKVFALVHLSHVVMSNEEYGFLRLEARRTDINSEGLVPWLRPWGPTDRSRYITLREWLEEQGHPWSK